MLVVSCRLLMKCPCVQVTHLVATVKIPTIHLVKCITLEALVDDWPQNIVQKVMMSYSYYMRQISDITSDHSITFCPMFCGLTLVNTSNVRPYNAQSKGGPTLNIMRILTIFAVSCIMQKVWCLLLLTLGNSCLLNIAI